MEWFFEGGPEFAHRPRVTAPLAIEEHPLEGVPIHAAHDHDDDHSFMERGIEALGPVAYSLLRSLLLRGMAYQDRRLDALRRRIRNVRPYARKQALEGRGDARTLELDERIFLVWELIEVFAESAELLGSLFIAASGRDDGQDVGAAILAYRGPAWSDIQSDAFADLEWWYDLLDLLPGNLARDSLDVSDGFTLLMMNRDMRFRVEQAVTELRHVYDRKLHRVAQRFKHSMPLLHVGYGLRWDPPDEAQLERVHALTAAGALVLIDQSPRSARLQRQFVVPATKEAVDVLLVAIEQARWLASCIASALVQRAEHPSHGIVILDPRGKTQPDFDQIARIIAWYGGLGADGERVMHQQAERRRKRAEAARIPSRARVRSGPDPA